MWANQACFEHNEIKSDKANLWDIKRRVTGTANYDAFLQ
jgi:hypothetical protein